MTSRTRSIQVGTMNVRSLIGKVGAVAALATEVGVNVLAMQETMIAPDSVKATTAAFRDTGWELHRGPQGLDARGSTSAGVAFITDVPAQIVAIPAELEFEGRVMAVKVARQQRRPLLVMCVYLPAADKLGCQSKKTFFQSKKNFFQSKKTFPLSYKQRREYGRKDGRKEGRQGGRKEGRK